MLASVFELDPRAGHVTSGGFAYEHLTWSCHVTDPLGDGHRQAGDVIAADLNIT